MIVGIGCDFIEISRFRKAMDRCGIRLVQRLFTAEEIAYCEKNKDPSLSFAGRFAAKEALAKALGVGIGAKLAWQDMEILNDPRGRPHVTWGIDVMTQFGVHSTLISISHSQSAAIAMAVLEG